MAELAAQGYVYEDGVMVVDRDWTQVQMDIQAYKLVYHFPNDMAELLYLNIDAEDSEFYIEGRAFVLKKKPTKWINNAITLHYRKRT